MRPGRQRPVRAPGAHGRAGQLLVLHTDSGLLGFLSSAAGAAVLGAGLAGLILLTGASIGMTERARVLLTSGWFLAVGMFLLREGRHRAHDGIRPLVPHDLPLARR